MKDLATISLTRRQKRTQEQDWKLLLMDVGVYLSLRLLLAFFW